MITGYDRLLEFTIYSASPKERHAVFRSPEFQSVWELIVTASQMNSRRRWVLENRYRGDKVATYKALGLSMNPPVSPERVRQIESVAIRRFKHPRTRLAVSRHCYEEAISELMISERYNAQPLRVREYLNELASLEVS